MATFKNPSQLAKEINKPIGLKQRQFDIVTKLNPMLDDYHTGIRSLDDIKTWDDIAWINGDEGQVAFK